MPAHADVDLRGEPSPLEPDPDDTLGASVRKGLGWSLLNSISVRLLNVAFGLVMARILFPEDYGIFAVGLLVLSLLQSVNELGTSVAVLRWPGDVSRASETAVTLSFASSAAMYGACYLAAPALAGALGSPSATTLLRVIALAVVLDGLSSIPSALLSRAFQQGRRALADLAAVIVSIVVGLVLASRGHGAMSLAWASVIGNLTATSIILALAPARPRPRFRRDDARALIGVGLPLGATSLVFLGILNVDYIVVGRQLGPESLGIYLLAFNLSMWPSALLSMAVRRVAIPAFGSIADDRERLSIRFAEAFGALAAVCGLAAVGIAFLSESLIGLLYGDVWLPGAGALRWLAVFGMVRVLIDLSYDALVAMGRSGRLLALQIGWLALLVPAAALGVGAEGIAGAGMAHVVVGGGIVLPAYLVVMHRAGIDARLVLASMRRPALAAGAASAVLALRPDVGPVVDVLGMGALATVVFAAVAVPWPLVTARVATWRSTRVERTRVERPRHDPAPT